MMQRIRAVKDHCDRTLDSFTARWGEMNVCSSTAYSKTSAFQLVNGMDSLRSLRNMPYHKMQSGAATLLWQSDNVLDIAQAICSRSRVLGFVNQHRVHLLMKELCRAANSCKPGALRVACHDLRTAAKFHTVEENPMHLGVLLRVLDSLLCLTIFALSGPAPANAFISPTAIFNDLLFKTAVRSDIFCTLVFGLSDSFVTAFNLRKPNGGIDPNCEEVMYGRIEMMTALCLAWASNVPVNVFEFQC